MLAIGLCCDVAGYNAIVALAGLVGDNIANIVKGIVYDQRRLISSEGVIDRNQHQDKRN